MRDFNSGFAEYIKQYISFRKASGVWCDGYERDLANFDKYCVENFSASAPLNQEMIDSFATKKDSELNKSRNIRLRALISFVSYLNKRNLSDVKPPERLKDEPSTYVPHAFTEMELKRFFRECDKIVIKQKTLDAYVKKLVCPVIFRLLYSSGIRTTEARLLLRKNVDLNYGILNIQKTKGHDQHYVALHPTMIELLKQYDLEIDKLLPDRTYFFENARGQYYSTGWLSTAFRDIWRKANPTSHAVPYQLRHNYATTNINSWENDTFEFFEKLCYLSKSMGHRSTLSTYKYYNLAPRLSDTIKRLSEEDFNSIFKEVSYEQE